MIIYKKPKGTLDILPAQTSLWQYVETIVKEQSALYGFSEIRFPTFEETGLYNRGVGDTTDVVQKEMYTFDDRDGTSLTLRPEGTAGVARSVLENGLYGSAMPLKLYYFANFFRRERPQAGRSREFWQFGTELFGSQSPNADAEVISLAASVFKRIGLKTAILKLNSIGCRECRPAYRQALVDFFETKKETLCDTCKERLLTNPLRILDCKCPDCKQAAIGAPTALDYLCDDCKTHFERLKELLTASGIDFEVDTSIVRGLDYYTRTVFEFVATSIGAQSTVCGGGRYDGLMETLGGDPLPGVGFGMGITRLIQLIKDENLLPDLQNSAELYIAPLDDSTSLFALALTEKLRDKGIRCETDLCGRSLKAQMKYADKTGAAYTLVIGGDEIASNSAEMRNMKCNDRIKIDLSIDSIIKILRG